MPTNKIFKIVSIGNYPALLAACTRKCHRRWQFRRLGGLLKRFSQKKGWRNQIRLYWHMHPFNFKTIKMFFSNTQSLMHLSSTTAPISLYLLRILCFIPYINNALCPSLLNCIPEISLRPENVRLEFQTMYFASCDIFFSEWVVFVLVQNAY